MSHGAEVFVCLSPVSTLFAEEFLLEDATMLLTPVVSAQALTVFAQSEGD